MQNYIISLKFENVNIVTTSNTIVLLVVPQDKNFFYEIIFVM